MIHIHDVLREHLMERVKEYERLQGWKIEELQKDEFKDTWGPYWTSFHNRLDIHDLEHAHA